MTLTAAAHTKKRMTALTDSLKLRNVFSLAALHGDLPARVHGCSATGLALIESGPLPAVPGLDDPRLGVDLLRLRPGESFPLHTHPGHHLLLILDGRGTVTFDGEVYETIAGDLYFIEGGVEHAVGATTRHTLLAFGAPHMPIDSPARMTVVE